MGDVAYICPVMGRLEQYNLTPEEVFFDPGAGMTRRHVLRALALFGVSLAMAALYAWLYFGVLGLKSPKYMILKRYNDRWSARVAIMNRDLDRCDEALEGLEMRNRDVYRSIFGMNPIPEETLGPALIGAGRYRYMDRLGSDSDLRKTILRLDRLTKATYLQSKSFDDVAHLSKRAGDMVSCLPAIPPVSTKKGVARITSTFGTRVDPILGTYRRHEGIDFGAAPGTPVYVTGDGVVESVKYQFRGYGNIVTVDHGFGYKTRYAHLLNANVVEGMHVSRGTRIGSVGSTGKSTGPHLHYEVRYRGNAVNPYNFFDFNMPEDEYEDMVGKVDESGEAIMDPNYRYRP